MDGATGSGEAVGDNRPNSRRVVNGDDAANRCATRRVVTDGGGMQQRRRGRAQPGHTGQGTDDGRTRGATSRDARRDIEGRVARRRGTRDGGFFFTGAWERPSTMAASRCAARRGAGWLAAPPRWQAAGHRAERAHGQGPGRGRG
jgi:hypothetical protein